MQAETYLNTAYRGKELLKYKILRNRSQIWNSMYSSDNTIEKSDSRLITFMRFPLSVLIVYGHTNFGPRDTNIMRVLYDDFLLQTICMTSVSVFFFIAGFLLFRTKDQYGPAEYRTTVKKRALTLLIPYFIWNMASYYVRYPLGQVENDYGYFNFYRILWEYGDAQYLCWGSFYDFVDFWCPALAVFWFLRDLMVLIIISPIIWCVVKCLPNWLLIPAGLVVAIFPGFPWPIITASSIFYFSLGCFFGIKRINICEFVKKYKYIIMVCFVFLSVYRLSGFYNPADILRPLHHTAGIGMMLYIGSVMSRNEIFYGRMSNLEGASFMVYAFHMFPLLSPVYELFDKLALVPYMGNVWGTIHIVLRVVMSVGLFMIFRKWMPTVCGLLTGGRLSRKGSSVAIDTLKY